MSWKKVSKGRFERSLGETEKLLWLIGASAFAFGKDQWHLFATAKLRFGSESSFGDEAVAALQKAWKGLRFHHPSLAVTTDGATVTYDIPDATSLEQWVDKTFIVERDIRVAEDVMAKIGPCEQAQLHVLPHARQIILHTAHWRCDGRGLPQLLDGRLHILTHSSSDSLRWDEEVSRLSICLEDAAGMVDQVSSADQARVKEMVIEHLKGSPALTIPCLGDADTQPRSPRRCLLTLTTTQTAGIIFACKARNLTVTSAIHAAIATTNIAHATLASKAFDYRSSIRRDLRHRLREPYNSSASATAFFTTSTNFNLPSDGTWTDFAKRLTDEYRSNYDDEKFRLHRLYYRQLVADVTHAASEGRETARTADVGITSIGLVENLLQREYGKGSGLVQVEEVGISLNSCSRKAVVIVYTFRDRLNLYMSYNEAFHAKEDMERFLEEIKETLVKELNIGVSLRSRI